MFLAVFVRGLKNFPLNLLISLPIFCMENCIIRLEVVVLLAYELYLKNKASEGGDIGSNVPIKKIFVNFADAVTIRIDPKTLEYYGENPKPNDPRTYFQKPLSMPSNNLIAVGLPNRRTGANSKKPYIEFYGKYEKNKLLLSITGNQKKTYEYAYNFENSKEPIIISPVDFLSLRLDAQSYFVGDKLLFEVYKEAGVVTSEGALSSKVFLAVCDAFLSFWKEKIVFEELHKFSRFSFRLVVLPFPLMSQGKVEYRSPEEARIGEPFEDCFGNLATAYPTKPTIDAKFFSFDDKAFTLNCKTGQEFYQNLGVGNESFSKINLPPDGVIRIAGLDWYFLYLPDPSLNFNAKGSGIYDQLRSNYTSLSKLYTATVPHQSSLKIICTKRAQAKLEVLLDENLTMDQMKKMIDRVKDSSKSHLALESLIIETSRDIIWADYITAIRHFMNGTYFDRHFLIQRFTCILHSYMWDWITGIISQSKKKPAEFFDKSQFCLELLTKNECGSLMNKNEEYAYKIGIIAGKYIKFKRTEKELNNSTKDILTYSKYDRERLRFVYQRVCIGLSLSKTDTDAIGQSIKNDLAKEEIADAQAYEDFSYFFYKGVFENLT
ncbi:MAG: hypothetical protein FWC74_01160 [Candidatus Bathyarchaeota archaeon]|nr:hypothetical protein [Candidatus Termitimicrobium sp.]